MLDSLTRRARGFAPAFKIDGEITFRLALYARVFEPRGPAMRSAVVLQAAMPDGEMLAFVDVIEDYLVACISGNGEAH